jgi:hypothetical protein
VKYEWANAFVKLGFVPEPIRDRYLKSTFAFNGLFEEIPRKSGALEFEKSFVNTIQSLKNGGFNPNISLIPVTNDGYIVNGAHRVAASAALGIDVFTQQVEVKEKFDFDYFLSRDSSKNLETALINLIKFSKEMRIAIVHSNIDPKFDGTIESSLTQVASVVYKKNLVPSLNMYINLQKINYLELDELQKKSWTGTYKNGYRGLRAHAMTCMGPWPIRFYFLRVFNPASLIDVKHSIREFLPNYSHSIHTTDNQTETFKVATSILHEESLVALFNRPYRLHTKLDDFITKLENRTFAVPPKFTEPNFLIGGSAAMDAHGIRPSRDIDILKTDTYLKGLDSESPIDDSHGKYSRYTSSALEMLLVSESHFYYRGVRLVSLNELLKMKIARSEFPKDLSDIEMIEPYLRRHLTNLETSLYPKSARINKILFRIYPKVMALSYYVLKLLIKFKGFILNTNRSKFN